MGKYRVLLPHQRRLTFERTLPGNSNFAVFAQPGGVLAAVGRLAIVFYRWCPEGFTVFRTVPWTRQARDEIRDVKVLSDQRTVVVVADDVVTVLDLAQVTPVGHVAPFTSVVDAAGLGVLAFSHLAQPPTTTAQPASSHDASASLLRHLAHPWRAANTSPRGRIVGHGVSDDGRRVVLACPVNDPSLTTARPLSDRVDTDVVLGAVCAVTDELMLIAERESYCLHLVHVDTGDLAVTLVASKLRIDSDNRIVSVCVSDVEPPRLVLATSCGRAYWVHLSELFAATDAAATAVRAAAAAQAEPTASCLVAVEDDGTSSDDDGALAAAAPPAPNT